jgi:hypothetical protein
MKKGMYVRMIKLGATRFGIAACPAPLYTPGVWGDLFSLPVAYWLEGYLTCDLVKSAFIQMDRYVRNGVVARGTFNSSRICIIRGAEIETCNSIYRVLKVPPLEIETGASGNCPR